MKVAVFCGCSADASPFLFAEMESLGRALARDGHAVIFGGTPGGCMGALAHGVAEEGGRLIGVVPKSTDAAWLPHDRLTETHVVEDLGRRKDLMNRLADAFVIFPGGLGTLDEAFTVLTLKSLGGFAKPIVFYNYMDVWRPMLEALDLLVAQKLIRGRVADLFVTLDKVEAVREHLRDVGTP